MPAIYVKSCDKLFITMEGENNLSVTNDFIEDKINAVIYSKSDITINGNGILNINSSYKGIVSKDNLKITGTTLNIDSVNKAIDVNDYVGIYDGNINIKSDEDGIHVKNSDDNTLGYVYILNGNINIDATDDGIHAESFIEIDGGTINIKAGECIESTYIQINDGNINLNAEYDGINAANKSDAYKTLFEMNGGTLNIKTSGDSDAIDSNGDIKVTGGTLNIDADMPFDYVGSASKIGGSLTINGKTYKNIPESSK